MTLAHAKVARTQAIAFSQNATLPRNPSAGSKLAESQPTRRRKDSSGQQLQTACRSLAT